MCIRDRVNNTATSGIINIYTDGSADSFGIAAGSGNNGLISNSNKISITAQNGNASAKKNTGIAANNIKNSGTVQIGSSIQAIDKAIGLDGKSIDNDGEILLYGNNAAGIFSDDENADVTIVISDNETTAMTGGQDSAGTGRLEAICAGIGVAPEHIRVVVPLKKNYEEMKQIIREEIEHHGVSVIIPRRECIQTLARKKRNK